MKMSFGNAPIELMAGAGRLGGQVAAEIAEGVGILSASSRAPLDSLREETSKATFGLQRSLANVT